MVQERLQKIIAAAGVSSRRAAEKLILEGRVRLNGRVVMELGTKADPQKDKIEVNGKRITHEAHAYVVLHKPRNVMSTTDDPEGRETVLDLVRGIPGRLYPVGRLDFATSGVLFMTNDGTFTERLLHPSKKVPKVYVVKLDGEMAAEEIDRWRDGIELDDGRKTLPAEVRLLRYERGKTWLELTLSQGRNQQIRRMAAASGFVAMRLARLSFAGVEVDGLRPGQWRVLSVDEQRKLKRDFGVPTRVKPQTRLHKLQLKLMEKQAKMNKQAKMKRASKGKPRRR